MKEKIICGMRDEKAYLEYLEESFEVMRRDAKPPPPWLLDLILH
jgi:hypothetical protein